MIAYYDARANEYDDVYSGKNPAIDEPDSYKKDVRAIIRIVSEFGTGHVIDIGCGTGFWLPYYAHNAVRITLIDESENMVRLCEQRAHALGIRDKCEFQNEDFNTKMWGDSRFDSALIGFFVSHIPRKKEVQFFSALKSLLRPRAHVLLIDSAWSEKRRLHREREGIQERVLNNGRRFKIFKRYFTPQEIEALLCRYDFTVISAYTGDVFLAAMGEKNE